MHTYYVECYYCGCIWQVSFNEKKSDADLIQYGKQKNNGCPKCHLEKKSNG
jgi:hypothetical protein